LTNQLSTQAVDNSLDIFWEGLKSLEIAGFSPSAQNLSNKI
jgi:hypothetical protein